MSINTANMLSAKNLTELMTSSLPQEPNSQLRNPYDAVALLVHACMLAVGFRLIGLGEDHKIDASSEAPDAQPLPVEWNATSSSNYAFRYAHSQSSLEYLIKISRLGSKAVINGLGIGDDKVHSFDIRAKDYLSESSLPFTLPADVPSENSHTEPPSSQPPGPALLRNLFISEGRITDFASLLKINIIQKLAPSLRKEGYEDSAHAVGNSTSSQPRRQPAPSREPDGPNHDPLRDDRLPPYAQPRPYNDPLAAGPRRPFPAGDFPPPDFEDEYEINRPGRGEGIGGRRPLNIGERDLYPPGLGPHDPLRMPGYGGGGGGGMHPTFDDPMFGGNGGAGMGYDPRAPPGARYDPIGPGDGPPNLRGGPRFPGRGGFAPGGMGGGGFGGGNPFGGFGGGDFI
ncbi:hypothetical protein MMC34_003427 [Xylographa carneopallida]|nr:hypothetical protein [Xylographa carneopallida]